MQRRPSCSLCALGHGVLLQGSARRAGRVPGGGGAEASCRTLQVRAPCHCWEEGGPHL